MKITTSEEIRQAEQALIKSGISAQSLMEDAARQIAEAIVQKSPSSKASAIAYIGKGNNAADALCVLLHLSDMGWQVGVRPYYPPEKCSDLYQLYWGELQGKLTGFPELPRHQVILLDGILGSGVTGEPKAELHAMIEELNGIRETHSQVTTWAIDIPTGLDSTTGVPSRHCVEADYTASIGSVKCGLLEDTATQKVGRIVTISLAELEMDLPKADEVLDSTLLAPLLMRRPYELYKNKAGHVAVIAGSIGMLGAARLCCTSALKSGAGLVTLYCLNECYPYFASSMSPEVMVVPVGNYREIDEECADVLLVGPGLGQLDSANQLALHSLCSCFEGKVILDADGINLAAERGWKFDRNFILTPHMGEMRRLLPDESESTTRRGFVERFLFSHNATIVLKGARTIIGQRRKVTRYNSTGGPLMASAGQGDLLAGVCAGLAAQGLGTYDAASLAVYICGVAAESIQQSGSDRFLASDCIAQLGIAFHQASMQQY